MRIFTKIPIEIENNIWEYTGLFKMRCGLLIKQLIIPIKIKEHFKTTKIIVHVTQTKIILCVGITKIINNNIHVFKVIIHPHKIIYVYSILKYFNNYKAYEFIKL